MKGSKALSSYFSQNFKSKNIMHLNVCNFDITSANSDAIKKVNCKGKSVSLQAWSDPEGSRELRFPDFMAMAQGGGKVVSLTHRLHLPPGYSPGTHFC